MTPLGKAFSDSLLVEHHSVRLKEGGEPSWWVGAGRVLLFATGLLVGFFILTFRLFDLTAVRGHEFRLLADGNRTRELTLHAPRGNLLDRTGKPLAANQPTYRLLMPCEKEDVQENCTRTLSREEGERMQASGLAPGEYLEADYQRQYALDDALAHAIGYVGELSREELTDSYYQNRNYSLGSVVGRLGAEAAYEERLRGRNGKELVEVDATGAILRTLGVQKEEQGEDITLALDAGLAKAARDAFPQGEAGAVIVAKPQTGEILALYSSPSFSPNAFVAGLTTDAFQTITEDPDLPMFNRAIGGVFPPGSTFKIITAIAALEEGAITGNTTFEDTGVITIGPFTFPNWYFVQYGKTEGLVDIVKGIRRSNDIFFYKVGEALGITKLAAWARVLGIGSPLGIELAGEASGLMPDPPWKNLRFNTPSDREARNNEWYLGDTYHVAIGQGYLLTTPLQVNAWTNVVANGGKLCRPTMLKTQKGECKDLGIAAETLDLISEGMREACAAGGTGWPLFTFGVRKTTQETVGEATPASTLIRIPVACKTGTAEFGDPKERTHAWFTVYGPVPDAYIPEDLKTSENYVSGEAEISVTVLVEGAGEGSDVAAPIAKKILEEWFGR
jgi:penicillin-binding protein 2